MGYTTLADLTARYGEPLLISITDRATPPANAVDPAPVDQAIAAAGELIDAHLAGRYALPLAEVPGLLGDIARALAIYRLHVYDPDPKIKAEHDQALRQLRDIADGRIRLSVTGIEPAAATGSGVRVTDRDRPLTEDTMRGYI